MKKNAFYLPIVFLVLITLSSCAPPAATEKVYGFLYGIVHGFIFVFALIGKIFGANIGLIAENNTGTTYYIGFLIGICILGGGGGYSARSRRS